MEVSMQVVARIRSDFKTKFGIPRQSGLVSELEAAIVFEEPYRDPNAVRGMEEFSHLWLIWQFSKSLREEWSPTVRPPRLGGNVRVGVFDTRYPYRPNPIGLSSVKIERIDLATPDGPIITVSGADLLDGTPIYDIKPYLPYTDAHPDARGGFAYGPEEGRVKVQFPATLSEQLPADRLEELTALLAQDPRPGYMSDPDRIYGMDYAGLKVQFTVSDGVLTVVSIGNSPNLR